MNTYQLTASCRALRHGILTRDHLRAVTSLKSVAEIVTDSVLEKAAVLAELCDALGLPPDTEPRKVLAALEEVTDEIPEGLMTALFAGLARREPDPAAELRALRAELERNRPLSPLELYQHHMVQESRLRREAPALLRAVGALVTLGVGVELGADGTLPGAVRLFPYGVFDTEKGPFIFDDKAAELVMAHRSAMGTDVMVDVEHLSLDDCGPNYNPDALAWAALAVRGGELWLVNIRWTPEGEERLRARRQRYLSPAFRTDTEGRVTALVNVALTSLPATHGAQALIAASQR